MSQTKAGYVLVYMRRDSDDVDDQRRTAQHPTWTTSNAPATITKAAAPNAGDASFDSDDDDDATEEPDSTMDVN